MIPEGAGEPLFMADVALTALLHGSLRAHRYSGFVRAIRNAE
jgi:hypothetical protein